MKFELDFFELFIQRELKAKRASNSVIPDFVRKTKEISLEVDRIKKGLRSQLFVIENESRLELLIQHHQMHIISLADRVLKFIDRKEAERIEDISKSHTQLNLCKILYRAFEELLTYIENYFSKYFNLDSKIPVCYAIISVKDIKVKIDTINSLSSMERFDPALLQIVLYPVIDFIKVPEKCITFRRLIYLKQLVKDLLILFSIETTSENTDEVCTQLYYLNFNTYYFLHYATSKISKEVQALPTLTEQLDRLSYLLKRLNQLQVKPGFALKQNNPSAKEQISTWLKEEIHYAEKKRQLTLMMPPARHQDDPIQEDFKITTIFSVSQLAYYIRLLIETNVITNKNQVELIRFISRHFSSIKNENLSTESLRRKYYNVDQSAITSVQGILHRMIDYSKKGA